MAGFLRTLKVVGLFTVAASCFTPTAQELARTPVDVNVAAGDTVSIPVPSVATKPASSNSFIAQAIANHSSWLVTSKHLGQTEVSTKLFGFIPWRTHIHVLPSAKVLVGGEAIGIRLHSLGPIVVGFRTLSDGTPSPGAKAHVRLGDMILAVNHHQVHSAKDLQFQLGRLNTGELQITVKQGEKQRDIHISSGSHLQRQLGLFVRDRTAGVGTLTYYDPLHKSYGALGHIITDTDTGRPVIGNGFMYDAMITGLKPGLVGDPGEKRGTFLSNTATIGDVCENTPYGVFGKMSSPPKNCGSSHRPIEVAFPEQVHEGPAKMYTVLRGQQVEGFDVSIDNVARQNAPSTKSMIIRVTDPTLLAQTGGIIQGMSGSPIVQDGRLVGAVTHVFVSDPTRGYAVFAMWMVREATHARNHTSPTFFTKSIPFAV